MNVAIIGAGCLGAGWLMPLLLDQGLEVTLYDREDGHGPTKQRLVPQNKDGAVIEREMDLDVNSIRRYPITAHPYTFVMVGTNSFFSLVKPLHRLIKGTIVCCDNFYDPAGWLRRQIVKPGVRVVNGLPWVSCFREGRGFLCETGYLATDKAVINDLPACQEIQPCWKGYEDEYRTRLLIHCATHAVVAYLGLLDGAEEIPDAMRYRDNCQALWAALADILPEEKGRIQREFDRFTDKRFPDPVLRVAREPSRKLIRGERLPALYNALHCHPVAQRLVMDAIMEAIAWGRDNDPTITLWLQHMDAVEFMRSYCGLEI